MALGFVWKITEDRGLINHVDFFADLDVNFYVHSSFLGTGMRVLSTFSIARSCKGTLMLPGEQNYCVTGRKLGVSTSL